MMIGPIVLIFTFSHPPTLMPYFQHADTCARAGKALTEDDVTGQLNRRRWRCLDVRTGEIVASSE
jgi:hypothetical protein